MFRSLLEKYSRSHIALIIVALLVVVFACATGFRTYRKYSTPTFNFESRQFDFANSGHSDFHNGAYFPSLAFREGVNPYSKEASQKYPLSRPAPPFSPLVFLIHLPFSFLDLKVADVAFFIFNLGLLGFLAWISLRFSIRESITSNPSRHVSQDRKEPDQNRIILFASLLIILLLIISRPGQVTLFTGYFTLEMVIGAVFAIQFGKSKPWLSAIGLLLASMKPTFVIPLALLMLCRKNFQAVFLGFVFSAAVAGAGIGWMAKDSSISEVIEGLKNGQKELHDDPTEFPVNTWTRTDIVGMVAKMTNSAPGDSVYMVVMIVFIAIPGYSLFRISGNRSQGASSLSGAIIVTSILLSIYHHSYDCLLIVTPWVGIALFSTIPELTRAKRWSILGLYTVVAANYLSTLTAREKMGLEQLSFTWQLITLINGVCLFIVLLILVQTALTLSPNLQSQNEEPSKVNI